MAENIDSGTPRRLASGVDGIDDILGGGLTPHRMYLIEGAPGAGKTTFALQFLLKGTEAGESGLYVTLSETTAELVAVAESHGWETDKFKIIELLSDEGLDPRYEQTILHPAEVELGETVRDVHRPGGRAQARTTRVRQSVRVAVALAESASLPTPDPCPEALLRHARMHSAASR